MAFNCQFGRLSVALWLGVTLIVLCANELPVTALSNEKSRSTRPSTSTVNSGGSPMGTSSTTSTHPTGTHLTNPNLEISLLDVEPEANLMLDELAITKLTNKARKDAHHNTSSVSDDTRHLALVHPANSLVVRSTFGPFFARHSIDPFANELRGAPLPSSGAQSSHQTSGSANHKVILAPSKQISAYLVTRQVRRSQPVLRVLFYASHLAEYQNRANPNHGFNSDGESNLCAAVIVQFHGERLFGTCSPSKSRSNACLAEVTIPALYWPPLDVSNGGVYAAKAQKSSIAKVFYTVVHTLNGATCDDQAFLGLLEHEAQVKTSQAKGNTNHGGNGIPSLNLVPLSDVYLVPFRGSYEEVTNDNVVTVLIPQEPVYPNSRIYIPVKYTYNPDYPVAAFSLRVQVKPGLKILGAHLSHANKLWQLRVELGPKQTTATVTAYLRDFEQTLEGNSPLPEDLLENLSQEVYSWLIEVEDGVDILEVNGRIVWQLLYNTDIVTPQSSTGSGFDSNSSGVGVPNFERESVKLTSLIDIQKDVVQQILPITRSREILNTAILNGRQVSRPMRIYQVSAGGVISDITFQCSCSAADESILKVSPSCTSVYLDGSEVRGSQNATVHIKYGSFSGAGSFIVWMPLIPLDVRVSDSKLSLVKGWRVPHRNVQGQSHSELNLDSFVDENDDETMMQQDQQSKQSALWGESRQTHCRPRFQQARIEVFTRFLSTDHNSGREASLLNRKFSLQITHLVKNHIRVTDSRVLELRGTHIRGLSPGRADVEVLSPLTGSVVGSRDVRVDTDRESITGMVVKTVAGIDLEVKATQLGSSSPIWRVDTHFKQTLTKQYQEALLDVRLQFSDGTTAFLSEISPEHYDLSVDTFKGVVAHVTRPSSSSNAVPSSFDTHRHSLRRSNVFVHDTPRIIALAPGRGELVHVAFRSPVSCHTKLPTVNSNNPLPALAASYVDIEVEIPFDPNQSPQNDANNFPRGLFAEHRRNNNRTLYKKNDSFWRGAELSKFNSRQPTLSSAPNGFWSSVSQLFSVIVVCLVLVICITAAVLYRQDIGKLLQFKSRTPFDKPTHRVTVTRADDFMHNQQSAVYQANSEWVWLGARQLETGSNSGKADKQPQTCRDKAPPINENRALTAQLLEPPRPEFIGRLNDSPNGRRIGRRQGRIIENPVAEMDKSGNCSDSQSDEDDANERMLDRLLKRTYFSSSSSSSSSSSTAQPSSSDNSSHHQSNQSSKPAGSGAFQMKSLTHVHSNSLSLSSSVTSLSSSSNRPPPIPPHRKESRLKSGNSEARSSSDNHSVNSNVSGSKSTSQTRHLPVPCRAKVLRTTKDSKT